MNKFWRWMYWLLFDLRLTRSLDEMLLERARLHEERDILLGKIAANERSIKQATLHTDVRVTP